MRYFPPLILLLLIRICAPAASVSQPGITSTSAVFKIRDASGPCEATLINSRGEVHPYINGLDLATTTDYVVWSDGTRVVKLGEQRGNRALTAFMHYTGTVCGEPVSFTTGPPMIGVTMPLPVPTNSATYDNTDYPQVDFSTAGKGKWYTDPLTGVELTLLERPEDFSRRHSADVQWTGWAGGSGWTNPGNMADASDTSYATIGNTNFIYLYPDVPAGSPTQDYSTIENIAVILRGGTCTGGNGTTDCDVQLGIGTPWGGIEGGSGITVRIGTGANGLIAGGSSNFVSGGGFSDRLPDALLCRLGKWRPYLENRDAKLWRVQWRRRWCRNDH